MATEVDWDSEKLFFESFKRETAKYYAIIPNDAKGVTSGASWKWHVEHVLYAALKKYFLPPQQFMRNKSFLQVAKLSNLYKVFERC